MWCTYIAYMYISVCGDQRTNPGVLLRELPILFYSWCGAHPQVGQQTSPELGLQASTIMLGFFTSVLGTEFSCSHQQGKHRTQLSCLSNPKAYHPILTFTVLSPPVCDSSFTFYLLDLFLHVCITWMHSPQRPEGSIRYPRPGVICGCELPCGCWDSNPGHLEEQQVSTQSHSSSPFLSFQVRS